MGQPKIVVLMSTYNGGRFLREQLDSILAQRNVQVSLLIRDDGSVDRTKDILEEYSRRYDFIKVSYGKNAGAGKSFMELLRKAPKEGYYAFADQDDVWLEDKLSRAVEMISMAAKRGEPNTAPVLYTCNQMLVDEQLSKIGRRFEKEPAHALLHTISGNNLFGCTMVWNEALQNILVRDKTVPSDKILKIKFHDSWVAMAADIVGSIVYDERAYILYRQHGGNVVGAKELSVREKAIDKYKRARYKRYKGIRSRCAKELLGAFESSMDDKIKRQLYLLVDSHSFRGGLRICMDKELRSSFRESKWKIIMRAVFGWI